MGNSRGQNTRVDLVNYLAHHLAAVKEEVDLFFKLAHASCLVLGDSRDERVKTALGVVEIGDSLVEKLGRKIKKIFLELTKAASCLVEERRVVDRVIRAHSVNEHVGAPKSTRVVLAEIRAALGINKMQKSARGVLTCRSQLLVDVVDNVGYILHYRVRILENDGVDALKNILLARAVGLHEGKAVGRIYISRSQLFCREVFSLKIKLSDRLLNVVVKHKPAPFKFVMHTHT